ncbi:MAG TPA: serine hydrolase [Chitinophagaceae bacterium]|jgi:beta-lactamase class A|nr:serine hydrolase [Chitinophagaceae bacterium]
MRHHSGSVTKACLPLLAALLVCATTFAQKPYRTDKKLTRKLQGAVAGFHGVAGVYVYNLKTGRGAALNADTIFPTASTIKLTILATLFDEITQGKLSYHQPLLYRSSMAHGGSGIMQYFKDSTKIDLSVAVTLMITRSDNTAALWCQSLAGGGIRINKWLAAAGFQSTRMNSRTPGREANYDAYGWGQTTPREIATLLMDICKGKILNPAACERMYRDLSHIYWDGNALSQIPPYVQTASKSGAVDASRSEVVLVNAPHGDYVFAVYTKDNKDQSWTPDNEAEGLIRKVSALLWHHFEPRSTWKPAQGMDGYRG